MMMVKISLKCVLVDIVILSILSSAYWFLSLFLQPTRTGFFCNDQTIRYPFIEESYPVTYLFIFGTSITLIIIAFTEISRSIVRRIKGESKNVNYTLHGKYVPNCLVNFYYFVGWFSVGSTSNLVFTKIAKVFIGRKRPFFMDVCKPSIGYNNCSSQLHYVSSYNCLGTNQKIINISETSFFSGHASYSFFVATFLTFYLHARFLKNETLKLLIYLIQFFLMSFASIVSYSRITEHWHHWSDVLTGVIVGSTFAYIIIFKVIEISYVDSCVESEKIRKTTTNNVNKVKTI